MVEKNLDGGGLHTPLSGGSKYLPFEGLNQEQEEAIPTGRIEDVLQKLGGSSLADTDSDGLLIEEVASSAVGEEPEESLDDDNELDLSAGEDDKSSDPVRMYLRQMGTVPLLTREASIPPIDQRPCLTPLGGAKMFLLNNMQFIKVAVTAAMVLNRWVQSRPLRVSSLTFPPSSRVCMR